jgi:helix-turn-helix protein
MSERRVSSDALTRSVVRALRGLPLNLSRFGELSRVPQSLLSMIRNGDRRATPAVADAIASALEQLGTTCGDAAQRIRRARQAASDRRTP